MKRSTYLAALLAISLAPCFADVVAGIPIGAAAGSDSRPYVIGWQFAVSAPVTVQALAYLDPTGGGLAEDHRVAIFDNSGTQLVTAMVPAGAGTPAQNGFRLAAVNYLLQPGTYVIAGQRNTNADAAMVRASSVRTAPQIRYLEEREVQSADFVFPATPFSLNEAGSFGPSFVIADAAPARTITSLVSSASFRSSLTSGSYLTIFGTNLASTTRVWAPGDFRDGKFAPTSLDGISATVGGVPAYVEYVSPTQINLLVPDLTPSAAGVAVTIQSAGQADVTAWVRIRDVAPEFFTWQTGTADNAKYAVAQHANGTNAGKTGLFPQLAPGFTTPIKPGETIVLYGSGFGPTTPGFATGALADKAYPVSPVPLATVGGRTATVAYTGLVSSLASIYQVNLVVPADLPDGDWPLVVSMAGSTASTPVLLTIAR